MEGGVAQTLAQTAEPDPVPPAQQTPGASCLLTKHLRHLRHAKYMDFCLFVCLFFKETVPASAAFQLPAMIHRSG